MAEGKEAGENGLERKVADFLQREHVTSLSVREGEGTWSANCFYVFLPQEAVFIFLSDKESLHARLFADMQLISGTIAGRADSVALIEGVQFKGLVFETKDKTLRKIYNKRFPFAAFAKSTLWQVKADYIKYTSNIISFGKKIHWRRSF